MIRRTVAALVLDDYAEPEAGPSFEAETFLPVLSGFFEDVVVFPQDRAIRQHGYFGASEELRALCSQPEPTLLFVVPFENQLDWTVVRDISMLDHVVTLAWMCDDHWRFDGFSRYVSRSFDFVATTDVQSFVRYHHDSSATPLLTQWGYDENRFRPCHDEPLYDVSFVGQFRPRRSSFIRALERAGIAVTVRGRGWPAGRVTTAEFASIPARSRISLNFADATSVVGGRQTQLKARPFELAGTGTCVVTEGDDDLAAYFDIGQEMIAFESVSDCVQVVRDLLRRPEIASQVGERGRQRAAAHHTYEKRFASLFAAMGVRTAASRGATGELCGMN